MEIAKSSLLYSYVHAVQSTQIYVFLAIYSTEPLSLIKGHIHTLINNEHICTYYFIDVCLLVSTKTILA